MGALLALTSATMGGLGSTLVAIQSAVGEFNQLVEAIDAALNSRGAGGAEPADDSPAAAMPDHVDTWGDGPLTPDEQQTILDKTVTPGEPLVIYPPEEEEPPEEIDVDEAPIEDPTTPPTPSPPSNSGGGPGGWSPPGGGSGASAPDMTYLEGLFPGGGGGDGLGPGFPGSGDTISHVDPLVLDLDGDGIELTSPADAPVYWDDDGDGVATLTGWVDRDDGLLARDLDGNGRIETQAELFGTREEDALFDLATQDQDRNGRIDAADEIWSSLRVWRDLNADGVSQVGELQTMEQAGIAALFTERVGDGRLVENNVITATSRYALTDGTMRESASVLFGVVNRLGRSDPPEDPEALATVAYMPFVKGFGDLADLPVAALGDPTLHGLVDALIADAGALGVGELRARFETIALRWAGVDGVSGANAHEESAQKRAFIEAALGEPRPEATSEVDRLNTEHHYRSLVDSLLLRFTLDLPEAQFLTALTDADRAAALTSPWVALRALDQNRDTGAVTGELEVAIHDILQAAGRKETRSEALDLIAATMPGLRALETEYWPATRDGGFGEGAFEDYIRDALAQWGDDPGLSAFAYAMLFTTGEDLGGDGADAVTLLRSDDLGRYQNNIQVRAQVVEGRGGDDVIDADMRMGAGTSPLETDNRSLTLLYSQGDGDDQVLATWLWGSLHIHLRDIDAVDVSFLHDGDDQLIRFAEGGSIRVVGAQAGALAGLTVYSADGEVLRVASRRQVADEANETLSGDFEAEVYVVSTGLGEITVAESHYTSAGVGEDRIELRDVTLADATIRLDGADLVIGFANGDPGDGVRVTGQFATGFFSNTPQTRVERFAFADGVEVAAEDMLGLMHAAAQTAGADTIEGTRFAETLLLGAGDDLLRGRDGADVYLRPADASGDAVIEDAGAHGSQDRLVLEGADLADVALSRQGDDLVLTLTGGSLTVRDQFAASGVSSIESFVFEDAELDAREMRERLGPAPGGETTLTGTADPETLTGTALDETLRSAGGADLMRGQGGSDLYHWGPGDGDDVIDENGARATADFDRVSIAARPEEVILSRVGGDVVVELLATGETLTLRRQLSSADGRRAVEEMVFDDGTLWDGDAIAAAAALRGTDAADSLNGTNRDERFVGGAGDDAMRGYAGADVYEIGPGEGVDQIIDGLYGGESVENVLRLSGLDLADLRFERVLEDDGGATQDLFIRTGAGDDGVLLENQLVEDLFAAIRPVQRVELSDGTVLDADDLAARAAVYGTDGDDVISAWGRTDGLGGDDLVTLTTSTQDVVIWGPGRGSDTVQGFEHGGHGDRVRIEGAGWEDLSFSRDGVDLVVTLEATGETLTLARHFDDIANGRWYGVSGLQGDDFSLDRRGLAEASLPDPTPAAQTITGGFDGETLVGGAGEDVLDGRSGSDLYLWRRGDGNDVISDSAVERDENPSIDTLLLQDVDRDGVRLSRPGGIGFDLAIRVVETGEVITLLGQLAPDGPIEWLRFADGSRLAIDTLSSTIPWIAPDGGATLETTWSDDSLVGGDGGDRLMGREGADAYAWAPGGGDDTIDESVEDYVFGEADPGEDPPVTVVEVPGESLGDSLTLRGVRLAQIQVSRQPGGDDMLLTVAGTGEALTVRDQFFSAAAGIEILALEDARLSAADLAEMAGAETLSGPGDLSGSWMAERFVLAAGDQTVTTGGGADEIVVAPGGGLDVIEGFRREDGGTLIRLSGEPFASFAALLAAATDTADGVRIELGGGDALLLSGIEAADLEPWSFGFARGPIAADDGGGVLMGTLLDDVLRGGAGDDDIAPLAGDDSIEGGEGLDRLLLSGVEAGYAIEDLGDGRLRVEDIDSSDGDDGSNLIRGIERLRFNGDGSVLDLAGNAPPTAEALSASMDEDGVLSGALPGADADGDDLEWSLVSGPAHGTVSIDDDGLYRYTPDADFSGQDAFEWRVSDGEEEATATVSIAIAPVNDAPETLAALDARFDEDDAIAVDLLDPGRVRDVDRDALDVFALSIEVDRPGVSVEGWSLVGGVLTLPEGAFDALDAGEEAVLSLSWRVGDGATSIAVSGAITVTGADDPLPVVDDDGSGTAAGGEGDEMIVTGAGGYDRASGGGGADVFAFGAELSNGVRERDVILDFEAGVDSILIATGHAWQAIFTASGAVIRAGADGDMIHIAGAGLTFEDLGIEVADWEALV